MIAARGRLPALSLSPPQALASSPLPSPPRAPPLPSSPSAQPSLPADGAAPPGAAAASASAAVGGALPPRGCRGTRARDADPSPARANRARARGGTSCNQGRRTTLRASPGLAHRARPRT